MCSAAGQLSLRIRSTTISSSSRGWGLRSLPQLAADPADDARGRWPGRFEGHASSLWRTVGKTIARSSDAETAAEDLCNSLDIAKKHYIEREDPTPIAFPVLLLQSLAPHVKIST